jgi:hypothetical protein
MNWHDLIKLLPVIAGAANPAAGVLATQLLKLAEDEITRRNAIDPSLTREQIIAESTAKFEQGLDAARKLRQKGHEI